MKSIAEYSENVYFKVLQEILLNPSLFSNMDQTFIQIITDSYRIHSFCSSELTLLAQISG